MEVRQDGRHAEQFLIISADILLSKGPELLFQTYRLRATLQRSRKAWWPHMRPPKAPFLASAHFRVWAPAGPSTASP